MLTSETEFGERTRSICVALKGVAGGTGEIPQKPKNVVEKWCYF